ncbi:MAG: serine hydrolase [Gammaproteobacteria bacterium]|nr:serine hydrolase [Gammaproteobacteria bacterium]
MKKPIAKFLSFTVCTFIYTFATTMALADTPFLNRFDSVGSASHYRSAIEQARQQIQVLMDSGAPGISIAVGVDQQIVWSEGFGYANVEHRTPVTTLTKFRIGSVSKPMTAIAMAQLYEQGLVDFDAPIQDYLTSFPVKEKGKVTLRLLASHRAGIRHYLSDGSDNFITDHYDNVLDALDIFSSDPLLFVPGERFSYSSYGYNLISAVIQEASGQEFISLMRDRVWGPLKLLDTVADHTDYIIENRASPYTRRSDRQLRNAPFVDNSYKWAGGGFLSTPSDLVRFGFGVFHGGIIKEETLQLLLAPPELPDGTVADQNYGLGWSRYGDNSPWVGHGGGSVGGTTFFAVHPEQDVVVAVTCNLTGCLGGNLLAIGELFID